MILVDTTVWVDHLNDVPTPQVIWLRDTIIGRRALLHTDRDFDPLERHLGLDVIRP